MLLKLKSQIKLLWLKIIKTHNKLIGDILEQLALLKVLVKALKVGHLQ